MPRCYRVMLTLPGRKRLTWFLWQGLRLEDLRMEKWTGSRVVSDFGATIRCADCGIFIGQGHADATPHGGERHPEPLCQACCRSAQRKASCLAWPDER
jgi:hypothetical protein